MDERATRMEERRTLPHRTMEADEEEGWICPEFPALECLKGERGYGKIFGQIFALACAHLTFVLLLFWWWFSLKNILIYDIIIAVPPRLAHFPTKTKRSSHHNQHNDTPVFQHNLNDPNRVFLQDNTVKWLDLCLLEFDMIVLRCSSFGFDF